MLPQEKPPNNFAALLPCRCNLYRSPTAPSLSQRVRSKAPTAFTATSNLPEPEKDSKKSKPRSGRGKKRWEGRKRSGGRQRCECLVASSGYKYENTEKEGLFYKSGAGPNGRGSPSWGRSRWVPSDVVNPTDVWDPKVHDPRVRGKAPPSGAARLAGGGSSVAPITLRMSGIQRLQHDLGAPRGGWRWRTHPVSTPTYMRTAANKSNPPVSGPPYA
jgi:hypothetical protein